MKTVTGNPSVIGVLIGGACIFIIVFGMKYAASTLSPILLAVVIAISVDPLINWLELKGLSSGLALLVTLIMLFLVTVRSCWVTSPALVSCWRSSPRPRWHF